MIWLPSSCIDAPDGYQWLKLLDGEEYAAVHQLCDNGMMVIDVNEDPSVSGYFSSFTSWHYALSGPEAMDTANWEQWWSPSAADDDRFEFAISSDCSICDSANNDQKNVYSLFNDDLDGDRTAYYMTGYDPLSVHSLIRSLYIAHRRICIH